MTKNVTIKPGHTISGIYDTLKRGDKIRFNLSEVKESTVRQEAVRRNRLARQLGMAEKWQVRYSVTNTEREGYVTVTHNKI